MPFAGAESIPKTIIYVDIKDLVPQVATVIRNKLPSELRLRPPRPTQWDQDPRSSAERMISVYHADISDTMKHIIQEDWRNGHARIMIATSAWGLGVNDPSVERIIQWEAGKLTNLDTLIQHFGRCARNPNLQGICLLFTEKYYFGPKAAYSRQIAHTQAEGAHKRLSPEQRRACLDEGLYKFINTSGAVKCRRKVILGYYGDTAYYLPADQLSTGLCCDNCGNSIDDVRLATIYHAVSLFKTPPKPVRNFSRPSYSLQNDIRLALRGLRFKLFLRDYAQDQLLTDT